MSISDLKSVAKKWLELDNETIELKKRLNTIKETQKKIEPILMELMEKRWCATM